MTQPSILDSVAKMTAERAGWSRANRRVALVPTMGALHEGHLALVRQGHGHGDIVVVSIFVNPTQFGPNEDLSKYPRTLERDLELLAAERTHAVFLPTAQDIYPPSFQTYVHNRQMAEGLCGAVRPGHFEGVLTVVMKLFNIVRPDTAVFGKKDYQQWRLIERMARDLCVPVQILAGETVREADGLAMSSRNRYLSAEARARAALVPAALSGARELFDRGERSAAVLEQAVRARLAADPGITVQYAEVRSRDDLARFERGTIDRPAVLLAAVLLDAVRLIDNIEFAA